MRRRRGIVLILLGLLLTLFTFTASGAIEFLYMERITDAASVQGDPSGIIGLKGFSGDSFALSSLYSETGTITNNSTSALRLRLFMDPEITAQNKHVTWSVTARVVNRAGILSEVASFSGAGDANPAGMWSDEIVIPAGESLSFQVGLSTSREKNFLVTAAFRIKAMSDSGLTLELNDTGANKRVQRYIAQ